MNLYGKGEEPSLEQLIKDKIDDEKADRRIFAIMGANGSGKTRFINEIFKTFGNACSVIPSSRRTLFNWTDPDFNSGSDWKQITLEEITRKALSLHTNTLANAKNKGGFNHALAFAISSTQVQDASIVNKHKTELKNWYDKCEKTGNFTQPPPPIQPIFPKLKRIIETNLGFEVDIDCGGRNTGEYIVSICRHIEYSSYFDNYIDYEAFSDGERQILLLSLLALTKLDLRRWVLVDEPELSLNESRAAGMWSQIEDMLPNCSFLYATHSPAFATRSAIDRLFIIGQQNTVTPLDRYETIPADIFRSIVGTRIQVIHSNDAIIFCEDAMSELLLTNLFAGYKVRIVVAGNCDSVISAVRDQPVWKQIRSGDQECCGIIDRDMRTNEDVSSLLKKDVHCLPYNEPEAIFLEPQFLTWVLRDLVESERGIDIERLIVSCAKEAIDITLQKLCKYIVDKNQCEITYKLEDSGIGEISVKSPIGVEETMRGRASVLYNALLRKNIPFFLQHIKSKKMYAALRVKLKEKYKYTLPDSPEQKFRELMRMNDFTMQLDGLSALRELRANVITHLKLLDDQNN